MAKYIGVLPSAARAASEDSPIIVNYEDYVAAHVVVDITDTSSITVAIKGQDTVSDGSYTVLLSPILTAGRTVLKVGPGLTAAANSIANDYMPANWFVSVSGAGTYSIGASVI